MDKTKIYKTHTSLLAATDSYHLDTITYRWLATTEYAT